MMITARETLTKIESAAKRIKKTKYAIDFFDEFLAIIPYIWDDSKNYLFRAGEMVNGAVALSDANRDVLEKALMDIYGALTSFAKGCRFVGEGENREKEIAELVKGAAKLFVKDEKTLCKKAIGCFDVNMDFMCTKYGTVYDSTYDPKDFYNYKKDILPVFVRMAVYGMAYDIQSLRDGGTAKSARNSIEKLILLSIIQEEENKKKLSIAEKSGLGRNDPCYCGSGKKFKNCCGR